MKRILMALALAAPLFAAADHIIIDPGSAVRAQAIRLAQQLRTDLAQLGAEAAAVADQALANGNPIRARRFREVALEARALSQRVAREVLRPLVTGVRLPAIARALDGLLPDLGELGEAVEVIQSLPPRIARLVASVVQDVRRLRLFLDGGRL